MYCLVKNAPPPALNTRKETVITTEHIITQYLNALHTLTHLAPHLNDQLEPTTGNHTDAYTPPARPASRPPCNLTWLDMQTHIEHLLKTACTQVQADTANLHGQPVPTIQGRCGWLQNHAEHLAKAIWLDSETWWAIHGGETTLAHATITAAHQLQDALDPPTKNAPARTTTELAALYGIKPGTIRQWQARGHIKPVGRKGRANLYPVDRVKELLAQSA